MTTAGPLVLVVDDDPTARRMLDVRMRALGCQVAMAATGQEALTAIARDLPAVILLDLQMPQMDGMDVLRALNREGMDVPTIVITAHGTIDTAVEAMKEGAVDFILKPFDPQYLEIAVRRALERRQLLDSNRLFRDALAARSANILGEGPLIQAAVQTAQKAAGTNSTVLLLGESGTGKEVFAHTIHQWSPRRDKPFVVVNCVALSEHLLESELFGHEKGAFTGAHQAKKGKFEAANGGTVFLDEIGDMPLSLQTKLLRVLQDHEFERVGGSRPISTDIRVLAATNRDLDEAVKAGRFRADLFYRLNVIRIVLPPLRDRKEDIPTLAQHFRARYAGETKQPVCRISAEAMDLLCRYDWPGNVRELANTIERAVVLCAGETITPADLALPRTGPPSRPHDPIPEGEAGGFHDQVNNYRRRVLVSALRRTNGNHTQAAKLLGLHRTYFLRLLGKLNIREDLEDAVQTPPLEAEVPTPTSPDAR
ncbi:MAG TPA: sigma-54 dependent transcriptional regulator [Candidatus Methylomirabilis sp.]|nr:sigma-54 dependent transcriptional regulator [Candidatus Methylomirabilis sp.]